MIEKIKELKFTAIIATLLLLVVGLVLLQSLLYVPPIQTRPGNVLTVPGINQFASYDSYEAIGVDEGFPISPSNRKVIKIYVESIAELSPSMVSALKQRALAQEGLTEDQVNFVLVEYDDLEQEEDYLQPYTDKIYIDPTDPSTFYKYGQSEQQSTQYLAEPITNMTFVEYVDITLPVTSDFEIYINAPGQYTVVLKGGYTREQFARDFLNYFLDKDRVQINYTDRDALRNQ